MTLQKSYKTDQDWFKLWKAYEYPFDMNPFLDSFLKALDHTPEA